MQYAQLNNGNMIRTINGRDVNFTPTSNEKVATQVASEESKSFVVSKSSVEENYNTEKQAEHEDKVTEYLESLEEYNNQLVSAQEDFDLTTLEMKPLYEGVVIKPYITNPFQRIKKEGGVIVDLGGKSPIYKSQEDGKLHEEEAFIKVGKVVEVGTKCAYVKIGDIVMWRKPSETMIPFYRQGFVLVNERSLIMIFNSGLTERFENDK